MAGLEQERSNKLMTGVQESVMSFHETPCTLCTAAVLGKVMVTVFVSSCLYTEGCLQSVFQQFLSNGKIRKSSQKEKVFKGQGEVY